VIRAVSPSRVTRSILCTVTKIPVTKIPRYFWAAGALAEALAEESAAFFAVLVFFAFAGLADASDEGAAGAEAAGASDAFVI